MMYSAVIPSSTTLGTYVLDMYVSPFSSSNLFVSFLAFILFSFITYFVFLILFLIDSYLMKGCLGCSLVEFGVRVCGWIYLQIS